jgi:hypothetical protein
MAEESSKKELEAKDALLVQEEVRRILSRYGKVVSTVLGMIAVLGFAGIYVTVTQAVQIAAKNEVDRAGDHFKNTQSSADAAYTTLIQKTTAASSEADRLKKTSEDLAAQYKRKTVEDIANSRAQIEREMDESLRKFRKAMNMAAAEKKKLDDDLKEFRKALEGGAAAIAKVPGFVGAVTDQVKGKVSELEARVSQLDSHVTEAVAKLRELTDGHSRLKVQELTIVDSAGNPRIWLADDSGGTPNGGGVRIFDVSGRERLGMLVSSTGKDEGRVIFFANENGEYFPVGINSLTREVVPATWPPRLNTR